MFAPVPPCPRQPLFKNYYTYSQQYTPIKFDGPNGRITYDLGRNIPTRQLTGAQAPH